MRQCLLCGRPLSAEISLVFLLSFRAYQPKIICLRCRRRFKRINRHHCCQFCGKCGDFPQRKCSDCRRWTLSATAEFRNISLYQYNDVMKQYMHRYKFQGDYRLRKLFQSELSRRVRALKRVVVPIPLYPQTYQQRGFNQVTGLLGTLKLSRVLQTVSSKKDRPQSSKSRQHRLMMTQPFSVIKGRDRLIRNQDLVVVDDVYTTGTTIRHAARLLKARGARSVIGVTLAH